MEDDNHRQQMKYKSVELSQKGFGKHKWDKPFKATKTPPKKEGQWGPI
jgi:hypothetical protein